MFLAFILLMSVNVREKLVENALRCFDTVFLGPYLTF